MHDTLSYLKREPVHRKFHHNELTFGLLYAFTENFVLPLSHDEVVHGKGSLIAKMAGDDWQKFANLRAYYAFMWGYPGKKLLFMGQEFAQWSEWSEERSLDWNLLHYHPHEGIRRLVRDLNFTYRSKPALHARDCEPEVSNGCWRMMRRPPSLPGCERHRAKNRSPSSPISRRSIGRAIGCRCPWQDAGAKS